MNDITCCFTGHRAIEPSETKAVAERLRATISGLIERGYTQFVAGGALGFDTLAAITVLSLRRENPSIKLHLALPCPEQAKRWTAEQKRLYDAILDEADSSEYVCEHYTRWCMAQRNRRMIELSSVVVAYYDGKGSGGTAMTVGFAEKKGMEIINLF